MAGNLGDYQLMTTLAKKVGGPKALGAILIGTTAILLEAGRYAAKRTTPSIKKAIVKLKSATAEVPSATFTVTGDAEAGGDLTLHAGDQFRELERDGDSILIEVLGNEDNPYFVSGELLRSISDFEAEARAS